MQKSVLVVVDYFKAVPKYKTKLLRHTKLMVGSRWLAVPQLAWVSQSRAQAHDEHDDCRIGDLVRVADSRYAGGCCASQALWPPAARPEAAHAGRSAGTRRT